MIDTYENDHSNNMDELLGYLCRERESRQELAIANTRDEERSARENEMAEHYRRMYEAAKHYRTQPSEDAQRLRTALLDMMALIRSNHPEELCSGPYAYARLLVGAENEPSAVSAAVEDCRVMPDDQASKWAFGQVKADCGLNNLSVGELACHHQFFMWGWTYRAQLEKQRREQE